MSHQILLAIAIDMDEIRTRTLVPGQRHRIRPVTVGLLFRLVPLQVVLADSWVHTWGDTA